MLPTISLGCDPEAFVRDKRTGKIVSAHNLLPGTKESPYPVLKGAIQVDGVAAEFNIDPAMTGNEFVKNITIVNTKLLEYLGPNHELVLDPVAVFDKEYFNSLPPETQQLGCNPDYNAWTGQVNDPPDAAGDLFGIRTASGHIHIGWTKNQDINDPSHIMDCNQVIKELDYSLGLPSLMWDRDNRRRSLYGKAGACRYKSYGVEYRVLSNRWLSDPSLMRYVYDSAYNTLRFMFEGSRDNLSDKYGNLAQRIIDNNEKWWIPKHEAYHLCSSLYLPDPKYWTEPKAVSGHSYSDKPLKKYKKENRGLAPVGLEIAFNLLPNLEIDRVWDIEQVIIDAEEV